MRAPKIHIVMRWNEYRDLIAWFFDEREAQEHCKRLCDEAGFEYAYRVEECESPSPIPERPRW